ncbi:MAG TPA: GYD domain-containing protein [bacterium]|nr:GYD domain-containing protein [bacterium]
MSTYVMLSTVTARGARTLKTRPSRIKEVNREVEKMGGRIIVQYALLGSYDFITVLEADNDEAVAKISLEVGSRGSVKITTIPAIPVDSFIANIKQE